MFKKLLLSLLAIFGFSLVLSGDTFAKDDVTVPVSTSYIQICSSDSSVTGGFCGYNYLVVSTNLEANIVCRAFDSNGTQVGDQVGYNLYATYFVLNNINFNGLSYNSISCRSINNRTGTFVLTDKQPSFPTGSISITENGTFDVTNYASATVNIPTETVISDIPPYSELVVDSFWQYHKAFAGAVVALIVIFLVYRVLKGRLK